MNIKQYYMYKAADGVANLPIVDTVNMENIPDGDLGAALQKRVEDNKKRVEADRKKKLNTALQRLYNQRYM